MTDVQCTNNVGRREAFEYAVQRMCREALEARFEQIGTFPYLQDFHLRYLTSEDAIGVTLEFENDWRIGYLVSGRSPEGEAFRLLTSNSVEYRHARTLIFRIFANEYEDARMRNTQRRARELYREALDHGMDPNEAQRFLDTFERQQFEHFRRSFQQRVDRDFAYSVGAGAGIGRVTWDLAEGESTTVGTLPAGSTLTMESLQAALRAISGGMPGADYSASAQERGLQLLRENLTPDQLQEYTAHKYFHVKGNHSGKTYRITHGRQQNVFEMNKKGRVVAGWCFLPGGGLVEGDVMLAQKLGLELDEKKVLKVANKFTPFGMVSAEREYFDLRPLGPEDFYNGNWPT